MGQLEEFINSEIVVWGEDYIFNLIESGYTPKLTDRGWRWFYCPNADEYNEALDTARAVC